MKDGVVCVHAFCFCGKERDNQAVLSHLIRTNPTRTGSASEPLSSPSTHTHTHTHTSWTCVTHTHTHTHTHTSWTCVNIMDMCNRVFLTQRVDAVRKSGRASWRERGCLS